MPPYVIVSLVSEFKPHVAERAGRRPARLPASVAGCCSPGRPPSSGSGHSVRRGSRGGLAGHRPDRRLDLSPDCDRSGNSRRSISPQRHDDADWPDHPCSAVSQDLRTSIGGVLGLRRGLGHWSRARLLRVGAPVSLASPGRSGDHPAADLPGLPGVRDVVHDRRADARARDDMPCTRRRRSASPPGPDPLVAGFRGGWMSRVLDPRVRDRGAGGCAPGRSLRTASASSDVGDRTRCRGLLCPSRRPEVDSSRAGSWPTIRLRQHRCRSFTARRGTRRAYRWRSCPVDRRRQSRASDLETFGHDDWGRTGNRSRRLPTFRVVPEPAPSPSSF